MPSIHTPRAQYRTNGDRAYLGVSLGGLFGVYAVFHSPYTFTRMILVSPSLWWDNTGKTYRIMTAGQHGSRRTARVKTYGDLLREDEWHPESKCADARGRACERATTGLLQRRHVRAELLKYIGKESNSLEEVESGLIHAANDVYTEYLDPRRDEWNSIVVPALKRISLNMWERETRKSRRILIDARHGRRPRPDHQALLVSVVRRLVKLGPA